MDQMAYRVLSRKRLSSQLLIDNRRKRRVKRVAVIEVATLDQRNSQSRERTRRGDRINGTCRIHEVRLLVDVVASDRQHVHRKLLLRPTNGPRESVKCRLFDRRA